MKIVLGILALGLTAAPAAEIYIRANQVGFFANGTKVAVAFSQAPLPEDFTVVGASNQVWFSWQNQTHHQRDVGTVLEPCRTGFLVLLYAQGNFTLKLGAAQSLPVRINTSPHGESVAQLLEFMRQQRCGFNPWLNTNCHQADGRTAYGPLTNGTPLDARGGWHDAGDLLKYLLTSGNATAQMLLAYELSPKHWYAERFRANHRAVAQNVPAVHVNAAWVARHQRHPRPPRRSALGFGLDAQLHPAPDQLYHQVADDRDHAGWRLPQNETVDYGWGKGGARPVYFADGKPQGLNKYQSASTGVANLAGRYAAAMALAYQIWRNDPAQQKDFRRALSEGGLGSL
jgi:endoglucanase